MRVGVRGRVRVRVRVRGRVRVKVRVRDRVGVTGARVRVSRLRVSAHYGGGRRGRIAPVLQDQIDGLVSG